MDDSGQCIKKWNKELRDKIFVIFPLGVHLYKCITTFQSQYLYWNFGYALGKTISLLIVGIDQWFEIGMFKKRHGWWMDYIDI